MTLREPLTGSEPASLHSPSEPVIFATTELAQAAGFAQPPAVGSTQRVRPGIPPSARVGDTWLWRSEELEPLKTRRAWRKEGRRVRPGESTVAHDPAGVQLYALDQTITEEEHFQNLALHHAASIKLWNQEWTTLHTDLDTWRQTLDTTPPPDAEFELRHLLERMTQQAEERSPLTAPARSLALPLNEIDPAPWHAALAAYRRRRFDSVVVEYPAVDHELLVSVDRSLITTETSQPEPFHLLPYWKYYGKFHKEVEVAQFARSVTQATRVREFHNLFPARETTRHFTLYLGPTNSGKTYQALRRLASAPTGIYLAPLRLLALEVADTLKQWGVPCHMVTGEERIMDGNADHTASTIEMLPLHHRYDLCVIDEVQMLGDSDRGWAWTQALLGVQAAEVCLLGAPEARPAIEKLLALTGDPYEVINLPRLSPLELLDHPRKSFKELEPGTAIIAFSRSEVLRLKREIETHTGQPVAVLYGALPPEVRREQARIFATGNAPFLVATDAIGMGLNLPIRTLLFAQDVKFINREEHPLTPMEVRQIAGRAGRFGKNEVGYVGTFRIPNHHIRTTFIKDPKPIRRAHLAPNLDQILAIAELRGERHTLSRLLTIFAESVRPDPAIYQLSSLDDQTVLARIADRFKRLELATRYSLSAAPVPLKDHLAVDAFTTMVAAVAEERTISLGEVLPQFAPRTPRLEYLETAMRVVNLYSWLHYRFPDNFPALSTAVNRRQVINQEINRLLTRTRKRDPRCETCGTQLTTTEECPTCTAETPRNQNGPPNRERGWERGYHGRHPRGRGRGERGH